MPYDPEWPQNGQLADADRFRAQFGGIKDLIDAINGGGGITGAVIDGVTTLPAGSQASVSLQLTGNTLHFTFGIPEGTPGAQGGPGPTGPQGPPFASAVVDSVQTLPAGSNASVNVSFDGTNVHFTFSIPQGNDGPQGIQGFQGVPGEVTNAQLTAALALKAEKPGTVNAIPFGASANYDPLQMQEMIDKYNELLNALK